MRDAVIVSTARTPIGRAYKGAFNATPGPTLGSFSLKPAIERAGDRPGRDRRCRLGRGAHAGHAVRQHRPAGRASRRLPGHGVGHDHRPPMLVGPDGDRHRRQADHHRPDGRGRRRRAGSISLVQTPEMRIAPDPSLMAMHKHVYMPMLQTAETVAPTLRHQPRAAGRICAEKPAAHRRGAGRRPVRRRDRPRHHDDDGQGQGDRRGLAAGSDDRQGRGKSRRHDVGGPVGPQPGARPRHVDHRRQCQPAVRRQLGVDPDGSQRSRAARDSRRWAATSAWRSPAPSPTRWASARSTR